MNTDNWHNDPQSWTGSASQPPAGPPQAPPTAPFYGGPAPLPKRRRTAAPIVATALIAGLIGGGVGMGGSLLIDRDSGSSSAPYLTSAPANGADTVDAQPGSITYAAQVASKFTADIKVSGQQGTAVGSGIVLSPDGYVLTNNHVVSMAGDGGQIRVTTADGKSYGGTVEGTAPSYDLAVIRLDGASGLTAAVLGNSSTLQVGQQVVAVGSPENLSNTVTSGIVSALSRTVTAGDASGTEVAVYNGLQTDTPINPGNSGGPLVNLQGQVIGVNSAVETGNSQQGGVQAFGLGFAIPVDIAKRVANELLQNGQARKPVLGVTGTMRSNSDDGAQITSVQSGSPADKAGISQGDVITKVGDARIGDYTDLMAQILTHTPGETVPVTVSSNGQTKTVQVTLAGTVDTQQTTVTESPNGNTP